MRDFIYDLRRTITGKFTIIAIVFIIVVSAGLGYALTAAGSSGTQASLHTDFSYTHSNGTYNVSIFAFNQNGQAAPTLPIYVQYDKNTLNLTTNSNGFVNYEIKTNQTFLNFSYSLSPMSGSSSGSINYYVLDGMYANNAVQVSLTSVVKSGTTNSHELLLYYSPIFLNQTSNTVYVYYTVVNITSPAINTQPAIQNMTYYSQVSVNSVGYQLLDINPGNVSTTQVLRVTVFNGNTTSASSLASQLYSPQNIISKVGLASLVFQVFAAIFGLFIPILASLSAYFYFGKDRASGVLESVITRPVTKGRIILSRYIANVSSMIVAFAIGTAVFDVFLYHATGSNLGLEYAESLIWTYFVEIAAFTGLIYLVSQYMKSQGAILGTAIALFLIFGIMWSGVIAPLILTYVFHAVVGTNVYQQYTIYMDMINPAGYSSLMVFLISPTNLLGATIDASQFGVTQLSVAIIGMLWFLVPIVIAFLTGRRRD